MVNAKFPAARAYGFEIVHGRQTHCPLHQSKIYAKRNESHFRQIGDSTNTRNLSAPDTTPGSRGAVANGGWRRVARLEGRIDGV
jgi:hypothetical protein